MNYNFKDSNFLIDFIHITQHSTEHMPKVKYVSRTRVQAVTATWWWITAPLDVLCSESMLVQKQYTHTHTHGEHPKTPLSLQKHPVSFLGFYPTLLFNHTLVLRQAWRLMILELQGHQTSPADITHLSPLYSDSHADKTDNMLCYK